MRVQLHLPLTRAMDTPKTLSRLEVALAGVEPEPDKWAALLSRILDCSQRTAQRLLCDGSDSVSQLQKIAVELNAPLGALTSHERAPFTAFGTRAAIILESLAHNCWIVADRHALPPANGDSFVLRHIDDTWVAARLLDKVNGRPLRVLQIEHIEPEPLPRRHVRVLGYSPDPEMAANLQRTLGEHGYSVEIHRDVGAAIEAGQVGAPDVLLVDDGPAIAATLSIDLPIRRVLGKPVRVISMSPLVPVRPEHVLERTAYSMGYYGCPRTVEAVLLTLAQIISVDNSVSAQNLEAIPYGIHAEYPLH